MAIEPPDFEVVGSADHISVTVSFPSLAPMVYKEDLRDHASLVIEEHLENNVKRVRGLSYCNQKVQSWPWVYLILFKIDK